VLDGDTVEYNGGDYFQKCGVVAEDFTYTANK